MIVNYGSDVLMSRVREDAEYFDNFEPYLQYAKLPDGKNDFTSYNFIRYIENIIQNFASCDRLKNSLPKKVRSDHDFLEMFRKEIVANECQQLYEFLKYSESYYLKKAIAVDAIWHEIIFNSRYIDEISDVDDNHLAYKYKGKSKNIDVRELLNEPAQYEKCKKNENCEECPERCAKGILKIIKTTSINNDTQKIKQELYAAEQISYEEYNLYKLFSPLYKNIKRPLKEDVIAPYYCYMVAVSDDEIGGIYKNYSRLYMEVFRPFSFDVINDYINPVKNLEYYDKNFNTTKLAINKEDYTKITDLSNKQPDLIEHRDQREEANMKNKKDIYSLTKKLESYLELYKNVLLKEWPPFFDKSLWKDNKFLEEYLMEKIFGLNTISYLCKLEKPTKTQMAFARLMNYLGRYGFNAMHKFIVEKILSPYFSDDLAEYFSNFTIGMQIDDEDTNETLENELSEWIVFFENFSTLIEAIHRIVVSNILLHLKKKRTVEEIKGYFKRRKLDNVFKDYIMVSDEWLQLENVIHGDKCNLACAILFDRLDYMSNRRINDGNNEYFLDRNKKIRLADDPEGREYLLFTRYIDPFLRYERYNRKEKQNNQ